MRQDGEPRHRLRNAAAPPDCVPALAECVAVRSRQTTAPPMKRLHVLFLLACGVGVSALVVAARAQAPLTPAPGEPPEDVLIAVKAAEYARINKAGGMPVTVTASGRSAVLKPRIWSAKKDGPCRAVPRQPDTFECSLSMMVTLREGDTQPGQHAERVVVHWDGAKGQWQPGMPGRRKQ